ncbi:MAG TPA: MarR family transcriptional regulator [Candidatus Saccharimonadales bacterium]|nr:MarR family transcriptional regulator [Candidatus Saccharimonadales bacterium]
MNIEHSLENLLQHTAALLSRQIDQVMQERVGLGLSQYRILSALERNPQLRQRQIAALLGQTEASVSRQFKILLERNLIYSQSNPKNRREKLHALTPMALRMLEASREAANQYVRPMLAELSERERKQLSNGLAKVYGWVLQQA